MHTLPSALSLQNWKADEPTKMSVHVIYKGDHTFRNHAALIYRTEENSMQVVAFKKAGRPLASLVVYRIYFNNRPL